MTALLWTCDDLLAGCRGALFDPAFACGSISGIEIDSRNCKSGDLFVALVGDKQDGHDFITKAVDAGAAACLVSRPNADAAIAQIIVDDPLRRAGASWAGWPKPLCGQNGWHHRFGWQNRQQRYVGACSCRLLAKLMRASAALTIILAYQSPLPHLPQIAILPFKK